LTIIKAVVMNVSVPGTKPSTGADTDFPSIICVANGASVHLETPVFQGNSATGVLALQNATVFINDGLFSDGVTPAGAGFIALGKSTVSVYGSKFINNTSTGW
jgi:hypothetical protein